MANFCLMIQYDGTRYNGWQRQGNTSNTIQEKLETILEQLYGEPVDLNGSGRTDAGVHALRQIANFRIPRIMSRYSCQKSRIILISIFRRTSVSSQSSRCRSASTHGSPPAASCMNTGLTAVKSQMSFSDATCSAWKIS